VTSLHEHDKPCVSEEEKERRKQKLHCVNATEHPNIELLSIIETLKEFRSMLCGCKGLHMHADHADLTCNTLNSQRILQ
jgi:hypothetical protein